MFCHNASKLQKAIIFKINTNVIDSTSIRFKQSRERRAASFFKNILEMADLTSVQVSSSKFSGKEGGKLCRGKSINGLEMCQ